MRILSGIQPSGKLHLGNYFGALRQFIALQHTGEAIFFIADWHALTSVRDGATLRAHTIDVALDYLALGLDPAKAVIFRQSDVSAHTQLAWILSTCTPMGLLERAHSYKDKLARGAPSDVGLFTYPVLMAADILLYGPDKVPVGQDQKQHLEIARDIAVKFNLTYVPDFDAAYPEGDEGHPSGLLRLPEPLILPESSVVPGVDGQKMSKSYHNTVDLFAPEPQLKKRIMGIVTDSTPVEAPKPADSALLALLKLFLAKSEHAALEAGWLAGGTGYGTYKKQLLGLVLDHFAEARANRLRWADDKTAVDAVLKQGAIRARELAAPRWAKICHAVGCGQPMDADF
jgi:tryptophanyl-tRNA synthetase